MRSTLGLVALFALSAGFFGAPAAQAQQTASVIRVASIPADIAAEVLYARDLGYFKQAGIEIEVTPLPNAGAILNAVASHSVDIGFGNVIMVAEAHEKGLPLELVAPANLHLASAPNTGFLAVKTSSPIRSAKDLTGKAIAVNGTGGIVHLATRDWIDENGGNSNDARFIEFPLAEMPALLSDGKVDAAVLDSAGYATLQQTPNAVRLLGVTFNAVAPNFVVAGWATTKDWSAAHPDLVRKFSEVMLKTAAWANAHHSESAKILANYVKLSAEQIDRTTRVVYGTTLNAAVIQPDIDLAVKYGALKARFAAADMMWSPKGAK